MAFIVRIGALLYFSGVLPTKITISQLESFLLLTCNILRGSMNAFEYREYVFGMLFLKRYGIDDGLAEQRKSLATLETCGTNTPCRPPTSKLRRLQTLTTRNDFLVELNYL